MCLPFFINHFDCRFFPSPSLFCLLLLFLLKYVLILHFAAAISLKYRLSCINHWPILGPIRSAISHRKRVEVLEDRLSAWAWCFYNSYKKANHFVIINILLSHTFSKSYRFTTGGFILTATEEHDETRTFMSLTTRLLIVIGWFAVPLPDGILIEGQRLFDDGNVNVKT